MEAPAFKPSILDRAISAISPVAGMKRLAARQVLHQFSYDGARATTKRAQAPAQIAPNSFSVQRDRLQLLREATDLENNFAPAKTLNRKYAMYVAPQGYHAQTGDSQLDTDVEQYLNQIWFPNADVAGRADFFRLMEFGVIGMNRGGDYGWAYMRPGFEEGMSIDDAAQLPFAIQPVESDRIGGVYQNVVSEDYVSGVIVGQDGAKVGYRVFRRGMSAGQYMDPVDVPASQFVHYLDPMLVDMYRGVSKLDAACSQLRDLYEMIDLTKGKSKLAAALTVFTNSIGATSGSGAMDGYSSQLFDNQQSGMQQDILYGQINHLTAGQDIKFPSNESPGTSDQYLMNLLLKLVAMSYNLPFSFALDATALGGVSSRLESEQAKAEFERGQNVLAPHAHRIKNAALIDAIGKGYFPASVADKIGRGRWSYRPHPQPDIGKEANAAMNLYQNGLLNPMQYWTDDAQDPENVAKDMVRWAVIKRDAAAREGFTVEEVFGSGPAKPTNISQSETTNTDENGQPVAKAFKQTPAEAERAAVIRELVDLLREKLPTDQAIAAAYHIYDGGKTRPQLVAEVRAHLKEKGHANGRRFEFEGWDESKHDRADDGKFGDGGGGHEKKTRSEVRSARASVGELHPATKSGKGKNSTLTLADGSPLPPHIKPAMIPPAYANNIKVSKDEKADVWATSEDKDGNVKRVYNPKFSQGNQDVKWNRVTEGVGSINSIRSQIHSDRNSGKNKEESDASWLMSQQATRPGSEEDTKGNKALWGNAVSAADFVLTPQKKGPPKVSLKVGDSTIPLRDEGARAEIAARIASGKPMENAGYWIKSHGATTLEGRHIVPDIDGGARLQFMGKEGVWHDHKVSDTHLAKMLLERKSKAGDTGKIFNTDYSKVAKYAGTLGNGNFSPKDLRTIRANELAHQIIGSEPLHFDSDDERKSFIKSVAEKVSGVLGNRPQQALESYINPAIFDRLKVRQAA